MVSYIRNYDGSVRLQLVESGGYIIAYNSRGQRVGQYNKGTDNTLDANNRTIGRGNLLATFA